MFTGIVEETGSVEGFAREGGAWRLRIRARHALEGVAAGDSIAVNGCCLTAVALEGGVASFDVLEETRRLTNFSALQPGGPVNLERSLRVDGRLGGHFVTGHIDGLGVIESFEPRGADHWLGIRGPGAGAGDLLVHKGQHRDRWHLAHGGRGGRRCFCRLDHPPHRGGDQSTQPQGGGRCQFGVRHARQIRGKANWFTRDCKLVICDIRSMRSRTSCVA